ncbi:MAG: hypothetical protein GC185_01310 [Alphaproteobacteria bacterium]|nr:hypothetical protein [Alphaproteobacteria bacterium]
MDKKPFSKNMRVLSRGGEGEDLVIEAQAPVDGTADQFRRVAFKSPMIDMLFEFDEGISGITLKNGVTIPVAMPFPELKRRIYDNDASTGTSIDLSLVTGKAVKEAQEVRLSKRFNPAAESCTVSEEKELEILVFAHQKRNDREFKRLRIPESKIGYCEPHVERKDTETFIDMKSPVDGWSSFYIMVPLPSFLYYVKEAKQNGQGTLDIMELSRPKTTAKLKLD